MLLGCLCCHIMEMCCELSFLLAYFSCASQTQPQKGTKAPNPEVKLSVQSLKWTGRGSGYHCTPLC